MVYYYFVFSHLAVAFIQSNLQCFLDCGHWGFERNPFGLESDTVTIKLSSMPSMEDKTEYKTVSVGVVEIAPPPPLWYLDITTTPMTKKASHYIHFSNTLQASPSVHQVLAARNEKAKVAEADGFFNQGYLTKM